MKPQPFREVKRELEAAGFTQVSQKGSHVNSLSALSKVSAPQ
jgi:predicted RNA binding protein YcfA (HicA-like mRNA interferase family)